MSDSEHSTVTYTSVSFPVEEDSDIGSPGVDGPPMMPEDPYAYIMAAYEVPPSPDYIPGPEGPPSPDYVPGPEEPEQAPPSPVYLPYVPEPVYPEYIPPEDDVFLTEEQPLHAATSPTAESPGYIPESDPEEDPEEDPADYTADREDDDNDKDEDEEEEEEHPAPADSVPLIERLFALTTPPPSPLTPLSSPLPHIPSPPPNSPTHIEIPESCLPLRKRVRFASPTPSHEVRESSAAGAARKDRPTIARDGPYFIAREDLYGFVDMVDIPPRSIDEITPTTVEGVNQWVTDLATIVEEETTSMYGIMEDAQDDRSLLRARVNLLYRDRPVHRRLAVMIEREAKMAREAWGLSMDASDYARSDVMSLRTTVVAQSALISELQSADHRRQRVISELLTSDHKRQVQLTKTLRLLKGLQTQMVEFQRQHGPAEGPSQPDAPGEAATQYRSFVQHVMQPEMAMIAILQERVPEGLCRLCRECTSRLPNMRTLKLQRAMRELSGSTQWNCLTGGKNSHVKTTTPEAAHAMPLRTWKKMMTEHTGQGAKLRIWCSKNVEFGRC
ncbi:hypothetical protein Tco_1316385 [Tanacetum coccineum]